MFMSSLWPGGGDCGVLESQVGSLVVNLSVVVSHGTHSVFWTKCKASEHSCWFDILESSSIKGALSLPVYSAQIAQSRS